MPNRYDALELLPESIQGSIRCWLRQVLGRGINVEEYSISNPILIERVYMDAYSIKIKVEIYWESDEDEFSEINLNFLIEIDGRVHKVEWENQCYYEALRLLPIQEYIKEYWSKPLEFKKPN